MRRMFILCALGSLLLLASCSQTELKTGTDDFGYKIEYEVNKKTQKKDGVYKKYQASGTILEEAHYKDDKLDGKRTVFFDSGKPYQEETWANDSMSGVTRRYYEGGQIEAEGLFRANVMEGEWKYFYKNGQLSSIVRFEKGMETGPYVMYWDNGKLREEGFFEVGVNQEHGISNEDFDDKWHGERKLYDKNGELVRIMDCDHSFCKTRWLKEGYVEEEEE